MADESNISLEFLRRQLAENSKNSPSPLHSGGGGGTFSGMETRVTLLEYRADQTEKTLGRIEGKLDGISRDVAEVKGRIGGLDNRLAGLPTNWTLLQINAALLALVLAVGIGVISVLKALGAIS